MTIKSLFNWRGLGSEFESKPQIPIERWHGGNWEYKSHGHGHGHYKSGSKSGGGNAVLSALALLAFLFLINVMQQSLRDNNPTTAMGTTNAFLLREDNSPILLSSREGEIITKSKIIENLDVINTYTSANNKPNRIIDKNGNIQT